MEKDPLTGKIIGCAIEVHRVLGPGLLESTCQQCLSHELHLIHKAQLLTYMKLSGVGTGLLINFNVRRLADGIERFKL